jgi:ArsR family transcriptional regulator, arsenate/arsenite/antimonite-responsive transcriptional repressor
MKSKLTASIPVPTALIVASFHALSDPLRLQVIDLLLEQELCVCDLCDILAVTQSKLSFHLKVLKDAQLVQVRQQGRWMYYSLNLTQFVALEQYLALRRCGPVLPARSCRDEA